MYLKQDEAHTGACITFCVITSCVKDCSSEDIAGWKLKSVLSTGKSPAGDIVRKELLERGNAVLRAMGVKTVKEKSEAASRLFLGRAAFLPPSDGYSSIDLLAPKTYFYMPNKHTKTLMMVMPLVFTVPKSQRWSDFIKKRMVLLAEQAGFDIRTLSCWTKEVGEDVEGMYSVLPEYHQPMLTLRAEHGIMLMASDVWVPTGVPTGVRPSRHLLSPDYVGVKDIGVFSAPKDTTGVPLVMHSLPIHIAESVTGMPDHLFHPATTPNKWTEKDKAMVALLMLQKMEKDSSTGR